jgi:hypothetical protein
MYSIEHNDVFIVLLATSFGRYDHHKANAIQDLKSCLLVVYKKCQVLWVPIYIIVNIC